MRKTVGLLALALATFGATGCIGWSSSRYGYYGSRGYVGNSVVVQAPATQVVYQQPQVTYQQPTVVYQQPQVVYQQPVYQQPVYQQPVYQQPVVLTAPPQTYYYRPTGYYTRPAMYGGVRIYIAP
jgi:hypothetical protein